MKGIPTPKIRPEGGPTRGGGTAPTDNDRPPIVGSVGRESAEVRLRVEKHTDQKTLLAHVHGYTQTTATSYTEEWRAYERVQREHRTVSHGIKEWARDDDGDGIREVHVRTPSKGCGGPCATS